MRYFWFIFAVTLVGGFYYTPAPEPHETAWQYIMEGRETWQSTTCTVIASICASIILMNWIMKGGDRGY